MTPEQGLQEAQWTRSQRKQGDIDAPTLEQCELLTRKYLRGTNPLLKWTDLPYDEQAQLLLSWRCFYSRRLNALPGEDVLQDIAAEARRSALTTGIKVTGNELAIAAEVKRRMARASAATCDDAMHIVSPEQFREGGVAQLADLPEGSTIAAPLVLALVKALIRRTTAEYNELASKYNKLLTRAREVKKQLDERQ